MINKNIYNRNTFLYLIFNQYIITNILDVKTVILSPAPLYNTRKKFM